MEKTTIQITGETLERLKMIKKYKRESYEEILNNLLDEYEEEAISDEEIIEIQEALENVKKGNVKPIEQVAKELKITLH
ncbi:hypothetical protein KAJ87_00400 [Candidatus Pacearchaeota archaeon]|nr:hypothetical protein [Candidatus Pacearchaeota archaeon]